MIQILSLQFEDFWENTQRFKFRQGQSGAIERRCASYQGALLPHCQLCSGQNLRRKDSAETEMQRAQHLMGIARKGKGAEMLKEVVVLNHVSKQCSFRFSLNKRYTRPSTLLGTVYLDLHIVYMIQLLKGVQNCRTLIVLFWPWNNFCWTEAAEIVGRSKACFGKSIVLKILFGGSSHVCVSKR